MIGRIATKFSIYGILLVLSFGGLALAAPSAPLETKDSEKSKAEKPQTLRRPTVDISQEQMQSVLAGLEFLANQQDQDSGAFGKEKARIAVSALSCLAFMANGCVPGRGPYGDTVERGLTYLVRHARPPDQKLSNQYYIVANGDDYSRMHGHGFATLALAEAFGMFGGKIGALSPDDVRFKIQAAVNLIEASQTRDGGWGYYPEDDGSHEGSITVCQLQALRSAQNAGFRVDKIVVEKALEYVRKSQEDDGGFTYSLRDRKTTYALTAAALSTLNAIGVYDQKRIDRGIAYMERNHVARIDLEPWFFYGNLYAGQAMFQHRRGKHWERWFGAIRKTLLANQGRQHRGAWEPEGRLEEPYGPAYGTACALLILQIPYQYLPIFQR